MSTTTEPDIAFADGPCNFINALLSKYDWDREKKPLLRASLEKILARKADPKLYLGVIGEFSSGKTTFLNTLLQTEFLKTHAIQGTTLVTTLIEYGIQPGLIVEHRDGTRFDYSREPNIGQLVQDFSTDPQISARVKKIRLSYPSPLLRQGIVIVDTPGIDSLDKNHLTITRQALLEDCDMAVVMIPAGMALSQTLQEFLVQYIPDSLHRCIFLLTKTELLRNTGERASVRQNTTDRLGAFLPVKDIPLYPAPTLLVLEETYGAERSGLLDGIPKEEKTRMIEDFSTSLSAIFTRLAAQKHLVLSEKLIALMNTLLLTLDTALQEMERKYTHEKELLEKNRIPQLENYAAEKKTALRKGAEQDLSACMAELMPRIAEERTKALAWFSGRINTASSKRQIREAIDSKSMEVYSKNSMSRIATSFRNGVDKLRLSSEMRYRQFEAGFQEKYRDLQLLKFSGDRSKMPADLLSRQDFKAVASQFAEVERTVKTSLRNESPLVTLAGAFDGLFSTSLLPDLENAIEGVFSFFFGKGKFLTTQMIKEQVLTKTSNGLKEYYRLAEEKSRQSLTLSSGRILSTLQANVDAYLHEYGRLIKEMIALDDRKKAALEERRAMTLMDQSLLKQQVDQLEKLKKEYKTK